MYPVDTETLGKKVKTFDGFLKIEKTVQKIMSEDQMTNIMERAEWEGVEKKA